MSKILLVLVLAFSWVTAVGAQTNPTGKTHGFVYYVSAVPRAVGRATVNMVTFKDKGLAVAQWANLAAVVADNWTTLDGVRRCSGCIEKNTLGIKRLERLNTWQIGLETVGLAMIETTTDQYAGEQINHDSNFYWRQGKYILPVFFSAGHLHAAINNSHIPSDPRPAAVINGLVKP
jgi:hypothetical protein